MNCPDSPSPVGNGWIVEKENGKEHIGIDWLDVSPAPEAVLQMKNGVRLVRKIPTKCCLL